MTGDDIVAAARGWLGTRFHHQGRLKKTHTHPGGVDCLGLLVGIARELGLKAANGTALIEFDETDYSHQPDAQKLKGKLSTLLQEIPIGGIRSGDVVLLVIDESPQHLGIISGNNGTLSIIHAYAPARKVVEHGLDAWWLARIEAVYRVI